MNERIEKLAVEAGMHRDKFGMYFAGDKHDEDGVDLEKFAELIVKECAKVCDDLDIDDWGDKSFDDGTYYCSRAIKEHFGLGMSVADKKQLIKDLLGVQK